MGLCREEQETTINFDRSDETATLYTADPVWIRRMDKLVAENPEQFKLEEEIMSYGEVIAKRYSFPKRFVSIRRRDRTQEISEEHRQELSERLKSVRAKRSIEKSEK